MGAINTEDAARRLARVILSDIDLYIKERPKLGESREAQIEEGRRLFASRVKPELAPIFAMVLADRAAGRVNGPMVAAAPAAIPTKERRLSLRCRCEAIDCAVKRVRLERE